MEALKLYIPTKLSDVNTEQLLYISRLHLMGYSETDFMVKALLYLSGLKLSAELKDSPGAYWCTHHAHKHPFILDAEQVAELVRHCAWILKPDEVKPLPRIGFARARHSRLYNASFEEYLMAENYYFAFVETKRPEHLDNLIACLYRKPWHLWNSAKIQKRAMQFRNTDTAIKNAVFMWYIGFRAYVPKRCKSLFNSTGKTGGSGSPFNARNYINGMIHQLNNGDITLKQKLLKQPVWDALDELEQRAIDFETSQKK